MNLLTIFLIATIILAIAVSRNYLKKAAFALIYIYAKHWDKWVAEVEKEHEMMLRRNVLKRRM